MTDAVTFGIEDVIGNKREQILALAAQYGASNVRIFGSVARHEARADSDIDILVDFRPDYKLRDHIGLTVDLRDLLGRRVDVAISGELREEFAPFIIADAIPL